MAESLAEYAAPAPESSSSTSTTTTSAAQNDRGDDTAEQGEVLSYRTMSNGESFAVVKVGEEDVMLPSMLSAAGVGVSGGSVPMVEDEGDKVELANALFGKSSAPTTPANKNDKGADGDLTGRVVTFADSSTGMIVAHRHPIAFVLLDSASSEATGGSSVDGNNNECSISNTKLATLDPTSIPAGSTVDHLGRHVSVLSDGSVSRSLPRAASILGDENIGLAPAVEIATAEGISLSVDASSIDGASDRPMFVPIPKISDIGLIDSPLVTGITAIDALTPIGKGQNMLVIGQEEGSAQEGVNKRGWMINLLRNVVENHKNEADPSSGKMRCYYGLTSGDGEVRSSVLKAIDEAGIQDDIVTVVSDHVTGDSSDMPTEKAMEAAKAVAAAAASCTLGEHHALTTGGDAVVIIDDINLHKSLWDITTQELVKIYGTDAVVEADLSGGSSSEMRGFFSGLIQRAARFNAKRGGGSVTLILLSTLPNPDTENASDDEESTFEESDFDTMSEKIKMRISMLLKANVPLTPTNLRKIQIPIPRPSATEDARRLANQHVDDLISMSDGQIWLDDELAKQGRSPPLDPSRSMTRVGIGADTLTCRADAPALRSVVGSLRFEFQQAMDVIDNTNVRQSTTASATSVVGNNTKQVQRRDAFLLAIHQETNEVRKLSQECILLLAASRGYFDEVVLANGKEMAAGTLAGRDVLEGLLEYVENETSEIVQSIDETLDLSVDERNVLEEAIAAYFK